jgi:hypothetical protein
VEGERGEGRFGRGVRPPAPRTEGRGSREGGGVRGERGGDLVRGVRVEGRD